MWNKEAVHFTSSYFQTQDATVDAIRLHTFLQLNCNIVIDINVIFSDLFVSKLKKLPKCYGRHKFKELNL